MNADYSLKIVLPTSSRPTSHLILPPQDAPAVTGRLFGMLGDPEEDAAAPTSRTEDKSVQPQGGPVKLVMVAADWTSYRITVFQVA